MRKLLRTIWNILLSPFRFIRWLLRKIVAIPKRISLILAKIRLFFTEEPEDAPLPDAFAKAVAQPEGIFEHLDVLRRHLLRSVLYIAIATGICFVFANQLIDFLAQPIGGMENMVAIDPTEPVSVFMRVSLLGGFALALPFVAFELFLFVAPGISAKSRKFSLIALPAVTLFFIAGMAFAYYIMMPTALPFLLNFMNMKTQVRPSSYINFVTALLFWIGILFLFPFFIYVLAVIRLVNARALANQWRLAVVIIAIAAAAITPTVDPITMSLVMGPMIMLYFLSIGMAYLAQRGRK